MALPTSTTPVAKSLHTITVIVQVARALEDARGFSNIENALDAALIALGLYKRPDPYGLRAKALVLLQKGA